MHLSTGQNARKLRKVENSMGRTQMFFVTSLIALCGCEQNCAQKEHAVPKIACISNEKDIATMIPPYATARVIALVNGYNPVSREDTIVMSKLIEYYVSNEKIGERGWHSNGFLAFERTYEHGVLNGVWSTWGTSGKLYSKQSFTSGRLHGDTYYYNRNGGLRQKIPFQHGKAHGIVKLWNDDGQRTRDLDETYISGERLGLYNIDGRSVSREEYARLQEKDISLPKLSPED